jgi:hypothetical protein
MLLHSTPQAPPHVQLARSVAYIHQQGGKKTNTSQHERKTHYWMLQPLHMWLNSSIWWKLPSMCRHVPHLSLSLVPLPSLLPCLCLLVCHRIKPQKCFLTLNTKTTVMWSLGFRQCKMSRQLGAPLWHTYMPLSRLLLSARIAFSQTEHTTGQYAAARMQQCTDIYARLWIQLRSFLIWFLSSTLASWFSSHRHMVCRSVHPFSDKNTRHS